MTKKITITDIQSMRDHGSPITMITAYDYPSACFASEAEIPVLLVGDTLGMLSLIHI